MNNGNIIIIEDLLKFLDKYKKYIKDQEHVYELQKDIMIYTIEEIIKAVREKEMIE